MYVLLEHTGQGREEGSGHGLRASQCGMVGARRTCPGVLSTRLKEQMTGEAPGGGRQSGAEQSGGHAEGEDRRERASRGKNTGGKRG